MGSTKILVFTEQAFYIKKICIEEFVVGFLCKEYGVVYICSKARIPRGINEK